MTEAEWDVLEQYVKAALHVFRLDHWDVTISRLEQAPGETYATTTVARNSAEAILKIGPDFRNQSELGQRQTIAHECIHLVVEHTFQDWRETLEKTCRIETFSAIEAVQTRAYERVVDHLAYVFAPGLPPIAWPQADGDEVASAT